IVRSGIASRMRKEWVGARAKRGAVVAGASETAPEMLTAGNRANGAGPDRSARLRPEPWHKNMGENIVTQSCKDRPDVFYHTKCAYAVDNTPSLSLPAYSSGLKHLLEFFRSAEESIVRTVGEQFRLFEKHGILAAIISVPRKVMS